MEVKPASPDTNDHPERVIPAEAVRAYIAVVEEEVANIDRAYITGNGNLRGYALQTLDDARSSLLEGIPDDR